MLQALRQRLKTLRVEYQSCEQELTRLESAAANVRSSMLRHGGAIEVLEEEIAKEEADMKKPAAVSARKR